MPKNTGAFKVRIVTSGFRYIDIDAYAGCVAYAELLNAQGEPAVAVSTAPLNESVTDEIRSWRAPLQRTYQPANSNTFTLIDLSIPEEFEKFVVQGRIDEIIDHHPEGEALWRGHDEVKAQIEFVGAACTLVFERWEQAGLLDKMSRLNARLLIAGILDNTLNFGAQVTTARDTQAYEKLLPYAKLPGEWPTKYFQDCQAAILGDITTAIRNDTKSMVFPSIGYPITVGQLVVWDGSSISRKQSPVIEKTLGSLGPKWFMNVVSISESKNYVMTTDIDVKNFLQELLGVAFHDTTIAETKRLWLRKEIMKADLEAKA